MKRYCLVLLAALVVLFCTATANGMQYSVTSLGEINPFEINDSGQIVGHMVTGTPPVNLINEGFLWKNGLITGLGFLYPADPSAYAEDINNQGQAVGFSNNLIGTSVVDEAFLWENGEMSPLGDLPGGFYDSKAWGINSLGQVIGVSATENTLDMAFLWENGTMTPLPRLPGFTSYSTSAGDINDNGQIAGSAINNSGQYEACMWNGASLPMALGVLPRGTRSGASDLNNLGQVVGSSNPNGRSEAFIWENGTMVSIGDSAFPSGAYDINDRGEVVGYRGSPLGREGTIWNRYQYGMLDLTSLLDSSGTGWTIIHANGVNELGQIVGQGIDPQDGKTKGVLLTPVGPEDGDGDGFPYFRDCDDSDPLVNPVIPDSDGDGQSACGGDCDDTNPDVYRGALEIKHDGIDQDCNGSDLTIEVTRLNYSSAQDRLTVEATSSLNSQAYLSLVGYGTLDWNAKKNKWSRTFSSVGGDPVTVTVSGLEGRDSFPAGGGPGCEPVPEVCDDGIDNDCDGLTDCSDSDCGALCGSPEICDDGLDNDLDGKVDCADKKDCNKDPFCK